MPSRKRSLQAVDGDDDATEPSLLQRIRNMWQFANLCQWIYIFGKAAKIPESIDIEEIETECLKPNSTVLADIALALLKLVSSHRGLTHDIFDDQARKQFLNKSPDYNPFGDDETPVKFNDFDIFTKIRVLQQLTQWTMIHPERVREKMEEQKDTEQTSWRIEPYGWDAEDRTYFVLDDNRVYRLTEPPPASTTLKAKKSKNSRRGRRSSKRRRTTVLPTEEESGDLENDAKEDERQEDDGLGGMNWECLAVTLDDVQSIVDGFRKTRDENEKILRDQLEEHLIPILEKQEQARKRRELQRERELVNLAKMANAKRSSRIAGKIELQKQEEKAREEERQHREAEKAKRREEQAQHRLERERDNRMISREQRLREREARRLQHEEELAHLSEDSKNLSSSSGRLSERRRQVEIERNKQALQDLADEEEDWFFDCVCGLYGQVDDGAHSVACEKCNVWQHSKCLGIPEEDADRLEFQFICASCTRRDQERARPRPTIKLKLKRPGSSGGHPQPSKPPTHDTSPATRENALVAVETLARSNDHTSNGGAEHGLPPVTSAASLSHGARTNGVASSNSWLDTRSEPSKGGVGGTPRTTQVIPAPIKLDAGYAERHSQADSPPANMAISTPMMSVKTPSPSNGIHSLQADKTIESALSTPQISRDIYRAAHEQNGTLPATGGYSPIKHSPPRPASTGTSKIKIATPILPPVALSPSPQHQVLTPPTKSSEPPRPLESR